jgi:hypothetical protein
MHLALRPYITTGVAIVGASVVAVAPLAIPPSPPDIQVANPAAAVERGVQLTANEIQTAVNALIFIAAKTGVSIAQIPAPLVAQILDLPGGTPTAEALLAGITLALLGPAIGGGGGTGAGIQDLIDSNGLEDFLNNFLNVPGLIIGGTVNGQQGPNLASLLGAPLAVLTGGLMNPGGIGAGGLTLPGTIPALQALIDQFLGSGMANMSLMAVAPDRDIEDGVNSLLFAATSATLRIVELAAPIVAPILGVDEDDAASFLAIGTLGFAGPLISGTGAFGTALQNVVDSDGLADLLSNSLDLVGLPIKGAVNGGFGPNLKSIVPGLPPTIPLGPPLGTVPVSGVFAPGLISNPDYTYISALQGIGFKLNLSPAPNLSLTTPGTIATLQGLVGRVFDALPSSSAVSTYKAPAGGTTLKLTEDQGDDVGAKVTPKKVTPKKNRPLQNILKFNPLDQGGKKDDGAASTNKHRPGLGKTPVANLVKRILGGDDHEKKVADTASQKPAE